MSFLDDLEEDGPCLASWCPRCKDDPAAAELRERARANAAANMTAPLSQVLRGLLAAQAQRVPATAE